MRFNSEADLAIFEKSIRGSPIRIPDAADMDGPFRYAREELPRLNAAIQVACPQYVPARFYCAVELFPTGSGRGIVATELVMHGSTEYGCIVEFLQGPDTEVPAIIDLRSRSAPCGPSGHPGSETGAWACRRFPLYAPQ